MNNGSDLDVNLTSGNRSVERHESQLGQDFGSHRSPLQSVAFFTAVLCSICLVEGIAINGLPNINNSNLEIRFALESKQTGFISSSGEIGAISVVLLVSFYGGRSHKPRVIAAGGYSMGLGCLLFLIPHILIGIYHPSGSTTKEVACDIDLASECKTGSDSTSSGLYPFFIIGRLMQGMGFTPFFTCGFAFIDDHAPSDMTAVYMGITYAITAFGAALGYVIGGQFLTIWVDIGRVDISALPIDNKDKRWVGAWWIGYAMSAALFFVLSTVICLFPRFMKGSKSMQLRQELSYTLPLVEKKSVIQTVMAFPTTLLCLLGNPLYILLVLVGTGDTLVVSGIASFAPKIIEEKFSIRPSQSGAIMGGVVFLGAAGGLALGGFIIRRFQLKLLGILKLVLVNLVVAALFGGGAFFIDCSGDKFAGVNFHYGPHGESGQVDDLHAICNSNCTCTTLNYSPICGENHVTYFSSCYAGCPSLGITRNNTKGQNMYSNCSCIVESGGKNTKGMADTGSCYNSCFQVYPFVLFMFLGLLFTFLNVTPLSMSVIRCVPPEERSIALGLQWLALRMLATIPGPILTGTVLDSKCIVWQTKCGARGNCLLYDRYGMSLGLFFWWATVKVLSLALSLTAYFIYTRHGHAEVQRQEISMSISAPRLQSPCKIDTQNPSDRPELRKAIDDHSNDATTRKLTSSCSASPSSTFGDRLFSVLAGPGIVTSEILYGSSTDKISNVFPTGNPTSPTRF